MSMIEAIKQAGTDGKLLETSVKNLTDWLAGGFLPDWAVQSIEELVNESQWDERLLPLRDAAGVEDLLLLKEQRTVYLKVDESVFDRSLVT